MKITRLGHAALLVEAAGARLLIDPGVFCPDETFALGDLDAIVLTHQHVDHVDQARLPALLQRNASAVLLSDPESAALLDVGRWTANADGLETAVGGLTLRGVGEQHAEITPQIPRIANVGVLVSATGEPTLFHPGDSYAVAPEGVDVLGLPLSAPWAKVSETIDFARRVSPTSLLPIHDGTIAEAAYGIYWQHVAGFGGVEDARRLGSTEASSFEV